MDIKIESKDTLTFDELENGDIFSYPHSNIFYMKIKDGNTEKMIHIPSGVVQESTIPGSDQPLVRRKCELSIYESFI